MIRVRKIKDGRVGVSVTFKLLDHEDKTAQLFDGGGLEHEIVYEGTAVSNVGVNKEILLQLRRKFEHAMKDLEYLLEKQSGNKSIVEIGDPPKKYGFVNRYKGEPIYL